MSDEASVMQAEQRGTTKDEVFEKRSISNWKET